MTVSQGLTSGEASERLKRFGKNEFVAERSRAFLHIIWDIVREPMFLLLTTACALYFLLGEFSEGTMMLVAMIFVTAISLYQEARSKFALELLRDFARARVRVFRDGKETEIPSEELVPDDIVLLEEGNRVPADAKVVHANDLSVNESILTGESFPVKKGNMYDEGGEGNNLYQGTIINSGKCQAVITDTGNNTVLGKLGKSIKTYDTAPTPLQKQIGRFVKMLALFGFTGLMVIWLINFLHYHEFGRSLLLGLTVAMSAIPEEIPVAFTSFMALGAYYMARKGMITRQPVTIENLGATSVLCLDKTGTITKNKMEVKAMFDADSQEIKPGSDNKSDVLDYALLASEKNPFDAMEQAIVSAYQEWTEGRLLNNPPEMIHEYPLSGSPPMMTHVYRKDNQVIIAAKGGLERILNICHLSAAEKEKALAITSEQGKKGYRVLGVAGASHIDGLEFPDEQDGFDWKFKGIVSFYDPPKDNIPEVLKNLYQMGIEVKLLTGDYPETALSISNQVGLRNSGYCVMGEEVMKSSAEELKEKVKKYKIFARMFPDAKLKVIEAIKSEGNITAMTGDGVNDGPALRSADIGIAVGTKGTEIAREASGLILTDDNLEKIVEAVKQGRKIYNNLKKAVRYIISIHIPIILTASLPLLLGWEFVNIFTPIHVIFLELIMGPTCSVFYEREPVEQDVLLMPPRDKSSGIFSNRELLISLVQGLVITVGILTLNFLFMENGYDITYTRTMLFTTLIISNIFLTFVNRSFTETIFKTLKYKNNLSLPVALISLIFLIGILLVTPVRTLFGLSPITPLHFGLCFITAFVSVFWFELMKSLKKSYSDKLLKAPI